jgi:hypothetical protein
VYLKIFASDAEEEAEDGDNNNHTLANVASTVSPLQHLGGENNDDVGVEMVNRAQHFANPMLEKKGKKMRTKQNGETGNSTRVVDRGSTESSIPVNDSIMAMMLGDTGKNPKRKRGKKNWKKIHTAVSATNAFAKVNSGSSVRGIGNGAESGVLPDKSPQRSNTTTETTTISISESKPITSKQRVRRLSKVMKSRRNSSSGRQLNNKVAIETTKLTTMETTDGEDATETIVDEATGRRYSYSKNTGETEWMD